MMTMIHPSLRDGGVCARHGRPVTDNPHPINSADYFRWHAAWHDAIACDPRNEAQRRDRESYRRLALMYWQNAASASLTETHGDPA